MKKIKHIALTVMASLLLSGLMIGCGNPNGPENPNNNNSSQNNNNNNDDNNNNNGDNTPSALQQSIDAVQAGGSITLDNTLEGSSIVINKKLTVNGNGKENVNVTIKSDVANEVKLTNFVNATVTITGDNSARKARLARAAEPEEISAKPKEIGEENPKLYFEECTFEKIIAEDDVTFYMEADLKKSTIKELELKDGIENFTIIEENSDDYEIAKKSLIEKLTIEKGVEEINLIGGYFNDIDFKGEFNEEDKVDFYYDEKGDQLKDDFKNKLVEAAAKVTPRDICNVKNGSGKYKFTIPAEKISKVNGALSIILLTDEQKTAFFSSSFEPGVDFGWTWATIDKPYFEIGYTGFYKFNTEDSNVHAICGDSKQWGYCEGEIDYTEYYEFYKNYTKEALCTQKVGNDLVLYLDLSNVLKSDLKTCAYKADGQTDEYYLNPNKITEIDLKGYKPYLVMDEDMFAMLQTGDENGWYITPEIEQEAKTFFNFLNTSKLILPISKTNGNYQKLENVYVIGMEESTSYPDVKNVVYNFIPCAQMIELYDIDESGNKTNAVRLTKEEFYFTEFYASNSTFDYYLDDACTHIFWNYEEQFTDTLTEIFRKPEQKITVVNLWYQGCSPETVKRFEAWEKVRDNKKLFTSEIPVETAMVNSIDDLIPGETYYLLDYYPPVE